MDGSTSAITVTCKPELVPNELKRQPLTRSPANSFKFWIHKFAHGATDHSSFDPTMPLDIATRCSRGNHCCCSASQSARIRFKCELCRFICISAAMQNCTKHVCTFWPKRIPTPLLIGLFGFKPEKQCLQITEFSRLVFQKGQEYSSAAFQWQTSPSLLTTSSTTSWTRPTLSAILPWAFGWLSFVKSPPNSLALHRKL